MAVEINGKVYRNLQEQVQKNKDDILEIKQGGATGYQAGYGIDISVDPEQEQPLINVDTQVIQNKLIAGQNITIEGDTIHASGELSPIWGNIIGTLADQTDLDDRFMDDEGRIHSAETNIQTLQNNTVKTYGNQTINGEKSFNDQPEFNQGVAIKMDSVVTDGAQIEFTGIARNSKISIDELSFYNGVDRTIYQHGSITNAGSEVFLPTSSGKFALVSEVQDEANTRSQADNNLRGYADMIYNIADSKSLVSVSASGSATDEVSYITIDGVEKKIASGGPGGSVSWGNIQGTLSNQTDLQNALNAKSTIIGSTQSVPGAITIYSVNVDGNDYNLPTGGGGGATYEAGFGIEFDTVHSENTIIKIDEQVVAQASSLVAETTRAEGEESRLSDLITAQESRLDGVEDDIRTLYNDKANQVDLTSEVSRASEAEALLNNAILAKADQSALEQEATTRANADTNLQTQIDDKPSFTYVDTADASLSQAIGSETTRASEAEATLNTAIGNEITARTNADTNITNTILSGKKIAVVSTLPASPDVNTIYFITGA